MKNLNTSQLSNLNRYATLRTAFVRQTESAIATALAFTASDLAWFRAPIGGSK